MKFNETVDEAFPFIHEVDIQVILNLAHKIFRSLNFTLRDTVVKKSYYIL